MHKVFKVIIFSLFMKFDEYGLSIQDVESDRPIDKITRLIRAGLNGAATAISIPHPQFAPLAMFLTEMINEQIPDFKQKRIIQLIKEIAVFCHENHVEIEKLKSNERVIYLTNKTINKIIEEIDEAKRMAYINILLGCWLNPNEKFEIRDYYFSILESLSTLEIHIIAFLHNPETYLEVRNISKESITGNLTDVFKVSFPDLTEVEFKNAVTNLNSRGLIDLRPELFGTLMASQGLEAVKGRWKEAGKRLVDYCIRK